MNVITRTRCFWTVLPPRVAIATALRLFADLVCGSQSCRLFTRTLGFLLLVLALFVGPRVRAAAKFWDGSADGNWANGANWFGGTAPAQGDDLVLPAGVTRTNMTNNFNPNRAFNSLIFLGSNYVLRGSTVVLSNGIGVSTVGGDNLAHVFNTIVADLQLNASQSVVVNELFSELKLLGDVALGPRTLTVDGDGTTSFFGVISGTGGAIVKDGRGICELKANNTFSGGCFISGGRVRAEEPRSLGTTNSGTIVQRGILETFYSMTNELITLSGGDWFIGGGTWKGTINIVSNSTILVFGNTVIDGPLLGTANLVLSDGFLPYLFHGELTLSGSQNNTFSGTLTVASGRLHLDKPASFTALNGPLIVGADIFGVADLPDTAVVRYARNNQLGNSAVTVIWNGILDLDGHSDTIGTLTTIGGMVTNSGGGLLNLGGNLYATSAGNRPARIASRLALGALSRTFFVTNGPEDRDLIISGGISGTVPLTKAQGGTLSLLASNGYSGATTVSAGILEVGDDHALGDIAGGVRVSGTGVLQLEAGVNVGAEALAFDRSGMGPGLQLLSGAASWAGPITLVQNARIRVAGSSLLTLSGGIGQPTGNVCGLVKDGSGTLQFAARSTFTGLTAVEAGTLRLNDSVTGASIASDLAVGIATTPGGPSGTAVVRVMGIGQISSGSRVMLNYDGLIDWSGIGSNTEILGSVAGYGQINLGGARLQTGGNNDSTSFDGSIFGVGGRITKVGTGRFTLNGPNTYTGVTVADTGELRVNGSQPSSAVSLTSGATLSGRGTVAAITGTGGVLAPGADVGRLTSGSLVLSSSDVFHSQIRGPNFDEFDQLAVNGTVDLSNAMLKLDMIFPLQLNQRVVILRNDGSDAIVGRFSNLPGNTLCTCAGTLNVNYNGGDGNDIEVAVTSATCTFSITDLLLGDNQVTLCWESIPGRKYRVEYATSVNGPWLPLAESITATDMKTCFAWLRSDALPLLSYRVALICD